MKRTTPESSTLKAIMDLLAAERIFALRMNTGAVKVQNRFFRFGTPGMADILAWLQDRSKMLWIEVKSATGKQSDEQKAFQAYVESRGMLYCLARSSDDVLGVIKGGRSCTTG